MPSLNDFYTEIARKADTKNTRINASDVSRVMACAFDVLHVLPYERRQDVINQGLEQAKQRYERDNPQDHSHTVG